MKKFISVLIISSLFIYSNVAISDDTNSYEWSTNIGTRGVFLRHLLNDKHNIFYGLRFSAFKSDSDSNDSDDYFYGVEIGHRYYLGKSPIQRFIDSSFGYRRQENNNSNFPDIYTEYYDLAFLYGLEKFFSKEFSVEGAAGIYVSYAENDFNDSTTTIISLPAVKVGINYYF